MPPQRVRPFAANDRKRISDDYEMLYPGVLDSRITGRLSTSIDPALTGLTDELVSALSSSPSDSLRSHQSSDAESYYTGISSRSDTPPIPPRHELHFYDPPFWQDLCNSPASLEETVHGLPFADKIDETPPPIPPRSSSKPSISLDKPLPPHPAHRAPVFQCSDNSGQLLNRAHKSARRHRRELSDPISPSDRHPTRTRRNNSDPSAHARHHHHRQAPPSSSPVKQSSPVTHHHRRSSAQTQLRVLPADTIARSCGCSDRDIELRRQDELMRGLDEWFESQETAGMRTMWIEAS